MQAFEVLAFAFLASAIATGQEPTIVPAGAEQVDSGSVVNYEEGRNVVIRRADGSQAVYPVSSNINWPPDLRMYGWVNVYFEPLEGGGFHVTRLTTVPPTPTALLPTPNAPPAPPLPTLPPATPRAPRTKPARAAPKGPPVRLSMKNAVTVTAVEPGRRITVRGKDGVERIYLLDKSSQLPPGLSVKQKVIVETRTVDGTKVVRRVVYPEVVISNVPKK